MAAAGDGKLDAGTAKIMMDMNTMMHDTNMQIINNIGGGACVDHYEGPYFVGCW